MGMSYRKSFKAGPIRVTASRSGVSYSAGVKGARVTKRANGRIQTTLSVPHTGVRYTSTASKANPAKRPVVSHSAAVRQSATPLPGKRYSVLPLPPPGGTRPLPFKGYHATVTLNPGWIQINRTFMGRLNGNLSTRVSWQELAGVDFLDPTGTMNGHVHFATAADPRGLDATGHGDQRAAAARNPRTILFTWQQRASYGQLRDLLIANMAPRAAQVPPTAPGTSHNFDSQRSVADELAKLHALCQQGVLTPAEFQQAKTRLLGR